MLKSPEEQEKYLRKLEAESRPLFSAILALDQPNAYTCAEFERFIKEQYGKPQKVKPHFLYQWSGEKKPLKALSKWLYSAAIDYLMMHHVNPIRLIPETKVAEHWARVRLSTMDVTQAKETFMALFKPEKQSKVAIVDTIEAMYLRHEQDNIM